MAGRAAERGGGWTKGGQCTQPSLPLSLRARVFFNCQQLIPCRNVANSCALILGGAARQLPFTADERVYGRQLHYLFIIYASISSDNGKEGGKKKKRKEEALPQICVCIYM